MLRSTKSPEEKQTVKKELFGKLLLAKAFWSYENVSLEQMTDDTLIEKVLLHLDIDDTGRLFTLYPEKKIKEVWKNRLCPLEPYYHDLNKLYAVGYFHIKNPIRYIKMMSKRHLNSLLK
jgi:hypothetical protein